MGLQSALLVAVLAALVVTTVSADAFSLERAAFVRRTPLGRTTTAPLLALLDQQPQQAAGDPFVQVLSFRGGATLEEDEEEEYDDEYDDEEIVDQQQEEDEESEEESQDEQQEEEEEIVAFDAKLAKATSKASTKQKAKVASLATKTVKKTVSAKLSSTPPSTKPAKQRSSLTNPIKKLIPYIIRASMNPLTFIQMTRAYWASLFNLDYLKDRTDQSQELRSALSEKAKRPSSSNNKKPRRKMKRGQAKTLSDLPQLST